MAVGLDCDGIAFGDSCRARQLLRQSRTNRQTVVTDVGRGAALNSFSLDSLENDDAKVLVLGALPSGHQTLLPDEINDGLRRQPRTFDKDVYFIVAQPAVGTEWTASINRLDGNGRVSTEVMPWKPSDKLREKMRMQTLDEKLRAYYRANIRSEEKGA